MSINLYDIKRKTEVFSDGVSIPTWTTRETRRIDVRPVKMSMRQNSADQITVDVGGQVVIPSYRGFLSIETSAMAGDRVTVDSGTTDLVVLKVYEYEDHAEIDLREVSDT